MQIYQFKASFQLSADCTLPRYKTMKFRGIFGNAYRKMVCKKLSQRNCANCYLSLNCEFAHNFHNLNFYPEKVEEKYKRFSNFPPKFVFYVSSENRKWKKDDWLDVIITFVDYPKIHIEQLIILLLSTGQFPIDKKSEALLLLKHLFDLSDDEIIFSQQKSIQKEIKPISLFKLDLNKNTHSINFLTHCRIVNKDVPVSDNINGNIFARRMKERLKLLLIDQENNYNCKWEIDEVEIVEKDIVFEEIGHRSNRQREKIELGGFIGTLSIRCENLYFWRDLIILEHLHIGSNAQGGYGKFNFCSE